MKLLRVILASIAIVAAGAFDAHAQGGDGFSSEVANRFLMQLNAWPQEKIYIHTDRDHYLSGDTIWFRTHVVNGRTHIPASVSRFVYVDLISPTGDVAYNAKLVVREGGIYSGHIALMETAPSGTYTMRAYTNFMKNAGAEYFPVKRIRISDQAVIDIPARMEFTQRGKGRVRGELTIQDTRTGHSIDNQMIYVSVNDKFIDAREVGERGRLTFSARLEDPAARNVVTVEYDDFIRYFTIPAPDDDFDVSFLPEGGYLIHGVGCTVGFKALRSDGTSVDVTGRIVDVDGNELAKFDTAYKGMGEFNILPYKGARYYAECAGPSGDTLRFELPEVRDDAVALALKHSNDNIFVQAQSPAGFTPKMPLHIIMHTRGNPLLIHTLRMPAEVVKLDRADFPSGVLHVLLTDGDFNVLSERLTFISNDDQAHSTVTVDREEYGKREPVEVTATVTDAAGNPLQGSFSVAVTDKIMAGPDGTSDIFTELLLASDLRGYVEDPAWYFSPDNGQAALGLEALMLTQGWRRYDVPKMLKGEFHKPTEYLELGDAVSGKVITLFRQNPVDKSPVTILINEPPFVNTTVTGQEGTFEFDGFDIPEGSRIFVQALSEKGKKRVELVVDQPEEMPVDPALLVVDRPQNAEGADTQTDTTYLHRVNSQLTNWNLDDVLTIEEVVVTAKVADRGFYSRQFLMGRTFEKKYIDRLGMSRMELLLMRLAPMMNYWGDSISYRNKPVRIIFDNWDVEPTHLGYFMSMSTNDIEYIEMARDEETMPFGYDFANGGPMYGLVFAVYSKGGKGIHNFVNRNFNTKTINPLGYQKAVEFYSPKYETEEENQVAVNDRRITLHWLPNLRTDAEGKATFRFWTADIPWTEYSILIEGVTDDGKAVHSTGKVVIGAPDSYY